MTGLKSVIKSLIYDDQMSIYGVIDHNNFYIMIM